MAPEAPKGMVDLLPAQKKKGAKNAAPANGASPIPNWPPEALREQGNDLFRRGDYGAAAEAKRQRRLLDGARRRRRRRGAETTT